MSGENVNFGPIEIKNKKIIRLRDWVNQYLEIEDENGVLDIDRAMRNINYSAGNFYSNLNGILMQERFKLTDIEGDLNRIRAQQYDKVKRFTDYQVDSSGIKLLVEGNEAVIAKKREYDMQAEYVDYIDRTMKQFSFYSNKVDTMIKARETKERYGGFI